MASRTNRRLICLLVALLFTVSGVVRLYAATAAMTQMPPSAAEGSMPSQDRGCDGKDKAAHLACLAMCAAAVAILSDPAGIIPATAIEDRHSASQAPPVGHSLSPEPPPPKT